MRRLVTTTYLQMTDRAALRRARQPAAPLVVSRAELPSPELNRFLYEAVGGPWHWHARRSWTREQWLRYLDRPELETWVGTVRGTTVGYFELERQAQDVEIAYFGLLPEFIGQGLGGTLLTAAIDRAWGMGAARVWVHTCDLDHPQALANYVARGMMPFRTEQIVEELTDAAPPWPPATTPSA